MITIPSGSKSQRFYVFAEDDEVFNEPTEELSLTIDSVINGNLGSFSPINTTIIENDIKPTVSLSVINSTVKGSKIMLLLKLTLIKLQPLMLNFI